MEIKDKLHKVRLDDFSEIAGKTAIRDFYIAPFKEMQRYVRSENSFILDGVMLSIYLEGNVEGVINGRKYHIAPGSMAILLPNQLIQMKDRSESSVRKSFYVSFDTIVGFPSPVDSDILNIARRYPVVNLSSQQLERLMEYYNFIEKRYSETDSRYRKEIVKGLLYIMMLEICDLYRKNHEIATETIQPKPEKLCDDFFMTLTCHYQKERSIGFYADKLHRSPRYLARAIQQITGRPIVEWINEAVISEIKIRLKTTDRTIWEISEDLNFSSPSVFVQFFKRNTGMTPLKYRQKE